MSLTRRTVLQIAGAASIPVLLPGFAAAQTAEQDYDGASNKVSIYPVAHASFVFTAGPKTIYVDPVGDWAQYAAFSAPNLVLITHEHGDHFDLKTLEGLKPAKLIVNPAVMSKLPDDLKAISSQLSNGEKASVDGLEIDAVPAYNTTEERKQFHPKGRDNVYVVTADGLKLYIAGDTEDTPEMRALTGIDIAFLPMNLPFTMTVEQAADAVKAFKPKNVYPYHYRGRDGMSDIAAFESAVGDASRVVKGDWYS